MDTQDPSSAHTLTSSCSQGSPSDPSVVKSTEVECLLDDLGFAFVKHVIDWIEVRGLEDQGLYRQPGVASRVTRLIQSSLDRRTQDEEWPRDNNLTFDTSSDDWEIRTVTSALKQFFRNLPEPLMSYRLHQAFIAAAKQESRVKRIDIIHCLVHDLPKNNFDMLHILMRHLAKVAEKSDKNLMTTSNLGVCFGPTLLRAEDESMSTVLDIKFANVVVEILIENCDKIFGTEPIEGLGTLSQSTSRTTAGVVSPVSSHHPGIYTRIAQTASHDQPHTSFSSTAVYATLPPRGASLSGVQGSSSLINSSVANNNSAPSTSYNNASAITRANSHDFLTMTQLHQQQAVNRREAYQYGHYHGQPVRAAPDIPSSTGSTPSSIDSMQQQPHQIAQQTTYGRSSTSSSNISSLPGYSSTNVPGASGQGNKNGRHGLQQCYPASQYAQSSSQHSQLNQHSMMPPVNVGHHSTTGGKRVRALYNCVGENPAELSFEANAILYDARPSKEPGWLEGTYMGRTGLIPANYVQAID